MFFLVAMLKLVWLRSRTHTSWIISYLRQRFCVESVEGVYRRRFPFLSSKFIMVIASKGSTASTQCNKPVIITLKPRFDVILTCLLCVVFVGHTLSCHGMCNSLKVAQLLEAESQPNEILGILEFDMWAWNDVNRPWICQRNFGYGIVLVIAVKLAHLVCCNVIPRRWSHFILIHKFD